MNEGRSDPIRGAGYAFLLMIIIPVVYAYKWYTEWRAPSCPVCGDTMGRVGNVGYVCDREGCEAYGDTVERARAREGER